MPTNLLDVDQMYRAATQCNDAAEAAAQCAASCLAEPALQVGDCAGWCIDTARVLCTCADLLCRLGRSDQIDVLIAVTRAAIIASQECAAEGTRHREVFAPCAYAADACEQAHGELQKLLVGFESITLTTA